MPWLQRGIDALPGMTILSACLETVSFLHLWQLCNWSYLRLKNVNYFLNLILVIHDIYVELNADKV